MRSDFDFQSLTYEKKLRVGVVTFTNGDRMNAITETRLSDMEAVLSMVETDAEIGALILTGGIGKAFCVGLDLDLLDRAFFDIPYFESVVRRLNAIVTRLEALSIPTIAAINGYCRAGGFEMSMGCDFIIVANEAKIGDVHTDAGVLPAVTSLRLKRRIGEQRAKLVIWSGCWLSGEEAVRFGLAIKTVPLATLAQDTLAFALNLVAKPKVCLATNKAVFQIGSDYGVAEGAELELRSFVQYMREQPYGKEGYAAYREGRQPSWKAAAVAGKG